MLCSNCDFESNIASDYGGAVALSSALCHTPESEAVDPMDYPLFQLQDGSSMLSNTALMGGALGILCYRFESDGVEYENNGVVNETYRGGAIFGT